MPQRRLPNYLRASRKQAGLSQDDLAFLLGCGSGTKVSRYELFRRQPGLPTVFALEAIFGKPARELFAGMYEDAEHQTAERARRLIQRLNKHRDGAQLRRKLALLQTIAGDLRSDAGDDPSPR
jgi:transcriptional regulator with XRE-family HTH domain